MTTNQAPKRALHFETKSYPRFGRGVYSDTNPPSAVKSSPFFWWFMFLRLNSDYQDTTKNNGVGKLSDLYKDFGDVANSDFKTWWTSHSYLFAEEPSKYKLKLAESKEDLAPFNSKEVVNVVVPLTWNQKSLKKHFAMLLNKLGVEQGKRGPKIGSETAKYSLGRRWNCGAMESAYKVYIARQANMEKGAKETKKAQHKGEVSAKFKVAWADIADMAKVIVSNKDSEGIARHKTEVRRLQTILATRHYKNALAFIQSSATKSFPSSESD
jgi:hypothetical protein